MQRPAYRPVVMLCLAGVLASLAYLYATLRYETYTALTDHSYYLSIADGLIEEGSFADHVSTPAQPVITPQNGVAFLYAALRLAGLARPAAVRAMVLIGYVLWVTSAVAFARIIDMAGLQTPWLKGLLLCGFLGAGQILGTMLYPGTHGVFHALNVWLVFFALRLLCADAQGAGRSGPAKRLRGWIPAALLSVVAIHFRLNVLVYLIAGLATALLSSKPWPARIRLASGFLACGLLALSGLWIFLSLIDRSGIARNASAYLVDAVANLATLGRVITKYVLEDFVAGPSAVFGLAFLVLVAGCLVHFRRKGEIATVFLGLSVLGSLLFGLLMPAAAQMRSVPHYIRGTLPFAWLLLARIRAFRPFIGVLIGLALALTGALVLAGNSCLHETRLFHSALDRQGYALPENAVLLSEDPRRTYTGIGRATLVSNVPAALRAGNRRFWIAGSAQYRHRTVGLLAALTGRHDLEARTLFELASLPRSGVVPIQSIAHMPLPRCLMSERYRERLAAARPRFALVEVRLP